MAGFATFSPSKQAELDNRADAFAHSLLEPPGEGQRTRLVAAMTQVELLLLTSMVKISVADPTSLDARWCFEICPSLVRETHLNAVAWLCILAQLGNGLQERCFH